MNRAERRRRQRLERKARKFRPEHETTQEEGDVMKLTLAQRIALQVVDRELKFAQNRLGELLVELGVDPRKQWILTADGELVENFGGVALVPTPPVEEK